jgi:hypothetical protein
LVQNCRIDAMQGHHYLWLIVRSPVVLFFRYRVCCVAVWKHPWFCNFGGSSVGSEGVIGRVLVAI